MLLDVWSLRQMNNLLEPRLSTSGSFSMEEAALGRALICPVQMPVNRDWASAHLMMTAINFLAAPAAFIKLDAVVHIAIKSAGDIKEPPIDGRRQPLPADSYWTFLPIQPE